MQTDQEWRERIQDAWRATNEKLSEIVAQSREGSGNLGAILTGAALGLALGLFIGWIVWPVDWVGARPTHLDADARAQYVAAVSDAYVAMGADAEALMLARRRLNEMDMAQAIDEARQYFAAAATGNTTLESDAYQQHLQTDGNIRISNLNQLATGLGLPVDAAAQLPSAQVPAVEDPNTTGAEQPEQPGLDVAPEPTTGDSGLSGVSLLLAGLAAVVLVVGGLYILFRLNQRQAWGGAGADAGEPFGAGADEQRFRWGRAAGERTSESSDTTGRSASAGSNSFRPNSGDFIEPFDPEELEEGVQVLSSEDAYSAAPSAAAAGYRENRPEQRSAPETFAQQPLDVEAPTQVQPFAPARRTSAAPTNELLSEFVAYYHTGLPTSYEEKRNIQIDAADGAPGGTQLGEYGMGVHPKYGVLPDAPKHVMALDVWLFDKSNPRNLRKCQRVLLSEYASDRDLGTAIRREHPDDPEPIVPQPDVQFQLQGSNLVLECRVLEAEYTRREPAKGVFEHVRVQMRVYRRA